MIRTAGPGSSACRRATWMDAAAIGRWLPSTLVRRLERLHLDVS